MKPVKKRFDLQVAASGDKVSKTFELDKNIVNIKGVLITSNRDDLLYYRGSAKIEINKQEFFPEDYESKLLMSGINVPPRSRYYDLGNVPAGAGKIDVLYKDIDGLVAFAAYRVSFYFDCEMEHD